MVFKTSPKPDRDIAKHIFDSVTSSLDSGQETLLLTAGGRAHKVYNQLGELMQDQDLQGLTVAFGDEHWTSEREHPDSSWSQLSDLDFWDIIQDQGAELYHLIQEQSLQQDAKLFDQFLHEIAEEENFIISWQGIGSDGHTSGILPADEDTFYDNFETQAYAISHEYQDNHSQRITITPTFLDIVDEIVCYAVGEEKNEILAQIQKLDKIAPSEEWQSMLHECPSLYMSGKNCTIYTDQQV